MGWRPCSWKDNSPDHTDPQVQEQTITFHLERVLAALVA